MKLYLNLILCLTILFTASPSFSECDDFVTWVKPAIDRYQEKHRLDPAPPPWRQLAIRFMPIL